MNKNRIMWVISALILTGNLVACSRKNESANGVEKLPATVVLNWNETAYAAFGGASYQHSLMASRINAMVQIAMHDAVNAVYPRYEKYVFEGSDPAADPVAAAASAAYYVLLNETPGKKTMLDSALQASLSPIQEGDAKNRGVQLGQQAANAILTDRFEDGAEGEVMGQIPPSLVPGVYQPVPPFNILFAPHWENLKLFSLESKSQFRPAAPPALNSEAFTNAFNEVKAYGKKNSTVRTADQTAYAKYWYEFSEAGWNRVARTVISDKKLNLFEAARLLALVDIALADAYTAGWDAKLYYNFWRPYTAIRNAGADNNNNTMPDEQWEPGEPTPPVQDYPSTHSALGNAAATVLARILGDNTAFTMPSPTASPAFSTRSFNSFSQAADENADSRVMAGIHFRFACEAGQELGNKIGNHVVDKKLRPLQ